MTCPICSKPDCPLYAYGREQYAKGRNRDHWRRIHAQLTGEAPPPAPVIHLPPPDPDQARIMACPDYNPGCCSSPMPYCSRFDIYPTKEQCLTCLSEHPRQS